MPPLRKESSRNELAVSERTYNFEQVVSIVTAARRQPADMPVWAVIEDLEEKVAQDPEQEKVRGAVVTDEMVGRATKAVVAAHDGELRAYLEGEVPANAWRPEKYAEAALRAALEVTDDQ